MVGFVQGIHLFCHAIDLAPDCRDADTRISAELVSTGGHLDL